MVECTSPREADIFLSWFIYYFPSLEDTKIFFATSWLICKITLELLIEILIDLSYSITSFTLIFLPGNNPFFSRYFRKDGWWSMIPVITTSASFASLRGIVFSE